jgi:protein associated with RNAse G/E
MSNLIGSNIQIQSYKHDESLHRIWAKATVVDQTDDYIVVVNKRTKVIESNGRFWHTREPSVTWFFKDKWFNIIGIIKKNEIHYYCNIASPYVLDDEGLKYIDYDLDVKVLHNFEYNVLDRNEYNRHQVRMEYSKKLKRILELELSKIKKMIENREMPFNHDYVQSYYEKYLEEFYNEKR